MEMEVSILVFLEVAFKEQIKAATSAKSPVSILVFLEVAFKGLFVVENTFAVFKFQSLFFWKWLLKVGGCFLIFWFYVVSILVFLEVAFKVHLFGFLSDLISSFNPCFSGSGF